MENTTSVWPAKGLNGAPRWQTPSPAAELHLVFTREFSVGNVGILCDVRDGHEKTKLRKTTWEKRFIIVSTAYKPQWIASFSLLRGCHSRRKAEMILLRRLT